MFYISLTKRVVIATLLAIVAFACGPICPAQDLAHRVAILKRHVERLHAVVVPEADNAVKAEKLKAIEEAVANGAASDEAFNALYMQIDEVRMWLWAHAAVQRADAREHTL